jgi:hypothetical protein
MLNVSINMRGVSGIMGDEAYHMYQIGAHEEALKLFVTAARIDTQAKHLDNEAKDIYANPSHLGAHLLEHLRQRRMKGNARFWGRECARLTVFGFAVQRNQFGRTAPYGWLARQTLLARPGWAQMGDTTMVYQPNGRRVEIGNDTNFNFLIHKIIEVEYFFELAKSTPAPEAGVLVREAQDAADEFLIQEFGSR